MARIINNKITSENSSRKFNQNPPEKYTNEKALKKELEQSQNSNKFENEEMDFSQKNFQIKTEENGFKITEENSIVEKKNKNKEKEKENDDNDNDDNDNDNDEDNEDEQDSQNEVFLSESIGLDITVDSNALNQFDYNESVENDYS